MKKLLATLFLAASLVQTPAPSIIINGPVKNIATAGGGATYLINQNFEGTGYDNSETWTESGTGTLDEDYTGVVLQGSQSFRYNPTAQIGRTISPTFAAQTDVWYYFMVQFVSLPTSGAQELFRIQAGSTSVARATISSAGAVNIRSGSSGGTSTVSTMAAGTTYHVWIHYTAGAGANSVGTLGFSTTGTKPTSGNNFATQTNGNATSSADNVLVGGPSGGSSATMDMVVDKVRVSASTIGDNPS